jgi:transposase InsO family protein
MLSLQDLNRRKYTPQVIDEVIVFLRSGQYPTWCQTDRARERYHEAWSEGFSVVVGDNENRYYLCYHDKRIVSTDQVASIVADAYNDIKTTGGRDRLFQRLIKAYIGISRRAVMAVLRNQETWQLLRPKPKPIVRQPILAKGPFVRFQIDLIDMSRFARHNKKQHWGLTVIDVFTKYAWVIPLKDKTGRRVARAFDKCVLGNVENINNNNNDNNNNNNNNDDNNTVVPRVVQSDNGSEFRSHHFADLAKTRGFKQIFSSSYSPSSNGCIERFNKTLKQLIRHHMVSHETRKWTTVLGDILENYNSAVHSSTRCTPDELVLAYHLVNDTKSTAEQQSVASALLEKAHELLVKRARKSLGSTHKIGIGDDVRILSDRRKKPSRSSEKKLRKPTWSREVYRVSAVSKPKDSTLSLPRYRLEGIPQRFYANELHKVNVEELVSITEEDTSESDDSEIEIATALQRRKVRSQELFGGHRD